VRRFLGRLAALLVVGTLLWAVGGRMQAERWAKEADRAWTALGTPMTAFAARFPKHGTNESARRLADVAASLGIEMAAPGASSGSTTPAAEATSFQGIRVELDQWLDAQLGNPSDRIAPPPEKLAGFLSAHANAIQYLAAQLQAGEVPVWEQDLDRLAEAPVPFAKGHRALHRLLCASALEAQRQGRSDQALERIDAAGRARASLQDRPELVSRLMELDSLGTEAGTLRKLEGATPRWYALRTEGDPRRSMLVSLQAEAWMLSTLLGRAGTVSTPHGREGKATADAPTLSARAWALYEKPYALLAAADYSRALARTAGNLKDQQACFFEAEGMKTVDERAREEIGRWNVMRLALPSVAGIWAAVDRARFQRELTAKVLELRALRSPEGAWPRQAPGIESSACPGNRWTYVVSADGGAVLTASQSPSRGVPAVRFEGAPPAKRPPS
jgi:hypothetical protein